MEDGAEIEAYVSYYIDDNAPGVGGFDKYVPICRKHAFHRDVEKILPLGEEYEDFIVGEDDLTSEELEEMDFKMYQETDEDEGED